jgi:hypothetical protein
MHPKSTQISVDHQKLGTRKNLPKISKITSRAPQKTNKNLVFKTPQNGFLVLDQAIKRKKYPKKPLQIRLFLCTPKWIFIFGSSQLAHAKIIEKRAENPIQISGFQHKWIFISGPGS